MTQKFNCTQIKAQLANILVLVGHMQSVLHFLSFVCTTLQKCKNHSQLMGQIWRTIVCQSLTYIQPILILWCLCLHSVLCEHILVDTHIGPYCIANQKPYSVSPLLIFSPHRIFKTEIPLKETEYNQVNPKYMVTGSNFKVSRSLTYLILVFFNKSNHLKQITSTSKSHANGHNPYKN